MTASLLRLLDKLGKQEDLIIYIDLELDAFIACV